MSPFRETSARGLLVTLGALLALAALSLGLRYAHLAAWGLPIALLIAGAKAVLVVVFFMEILTEKPTILFALLAGLTLVATLLALVIADVVTRADAPLGAPPGMALRDHG